MAIEYFCCYHSYIEVIEQLNDAEKGRLFMACLTYSKLGEVPQLCGNERFVFPGIKAQIDRDNAKYDAKCKRQAENAKKRWDATACHGMPNHANDAKAKEKEKAKEKAKAKAKANTPPTPSSGGTHQDPSETELSRLSPALRSAMEKWLKYKQERREAYKPTGLTALVSQVINEAGRAGEQPVVDVVELSMANGYKGIVFDRLKSGNQQKPAQNRPKPGGNVFLELLEDEA